MQSLIDCKFIHRQLTRSISAKTDLFEYTCLLQLLENRMVSHPFGNSHCVSIYNEQSGLFSCVFMWPMSFARVNYSNAKFFQITSLALSRAFSLSCKSSLLIARIPLTN